MATTATNHWKLGLFVVLAIGVLIAVTFWMGARRFERDAFQAVSYFDESVQGLEVGSPVKWRGVTVGTVAEITVAPDGRQVQVTSDIYSDALSRLGLEQPVAGGTFIDPNLRVQLASAGITGVRFLQTDFFDPVRYPPPVLAANGIRPTSSSPTIHASCARGRGTRLPRSRPLSSRPRSRSGAAVRAGVPGTTAPRPVAAMRSARSLSPTGRSSPSHGARYR